LGLTTKPQEIPKSFIVLRSRTKFWLFSITDWPHKMRVLINGKTRSIKSWYELLFWCWLEISLSIR
jgi:hypothetical protein